MNPPSSVSAGDFHAPLPGRTFKIFMVFFHVSLVGGLAGALAVTAWQTRADLGWRQAVLAGLVAAQIALYLWSFAFLDRRPLPGWWYPVYFLVNLGIWVGEKALSPFFGWVICYFFAQLLAALPPRRSLPLAAIYLAVAVQVFWGWRAVAALKPMELLIWGVSGISWIAIGLFIHHLANTSGERAKLIVELEAAKRELELARQRDAEMATLRERERLARELHDSLGHALVALTVQLEAVQRLYTVDPPRASAQLDELKALTRSSMEDLRRSLANLRTPGLGERRLSDALRALADQLSSRARLTIDLQLPPEVDRLQPAVAEALWHVAQEALVNAEKHARATHATLTATCEPKWVKLRAGDDGVGLPPDAERRPGHFGLRGLRERVEGLGGTLALTGAPGQGTVIEARLPIC